MSTKATVRVVKADGSRGVLSIDPREVASASVLSIDGSLYLFSGVRDGVVVFTQGGRMLDVTSKVEWDQ